MSSLDKAGIKQSFSAASVTYDSVAQLQRAVGKELLHTVDTAKLTGAILDVGCGTGFLTSALLETVPLCANPRFIIALDIAWSMLHATRSKLADQANVRYICADAERLPMPALSIDHVFSNLALQWCRPLDGVFADIKRILKPEGQLVFSTFGPQTLQELKAAWAEADDHHHVNEFYSEKELRQFLQQTGFKRVYIENRLYVPRYDSVSALMHELKTLGAHNVMAGRNKNITPKNRLQRMMAAYEKHRSGGQLPATFAVMLVSATA